MRDDQLKEKFNKAGNICFASRIGSTSPLPPPYLPPSISIDSLKGTTLDVEMKEEKKRVVPWGRGS
jgi:hypothetical protein